MQNIDGTKPHEYIAGLFAQCRLCKLAQSNKIHQSQIEQPEQDISEVRQANAHEHTCVICGRKHYCEIINCTIPANFTCDCKEVPGFSLLNQVIIANSQPIIKCIGHTCVQCKKVWLHDYQCNKPANLEAYCSNCIAQNAIEINRPDLIKEIANNGQNALSGAEQAELFLNHEAQVDLMIHDSSGNLLENWNGIIVQHLEELRKIQAKIKIHEQATSKVRIKTLRDETTKLSPEEQEQYKRDALKTKRKSQAAKTDEAKRAAYNKAISDSVKVMVQAGMSHDKAEKRAIKILGSFDADSLCSEKGSN